MGDQSIISALLLGIIEGLTEFIPVSSTAHVLLAGHFLGFKSPGNTFAVLIQLGAILAILLVYFQKLKTYHQNPSNYAGDRVWHEDFIDQKESYNDLNLVSYMNKFLFAEDIAYHRYNPLLIDFLNDKESQKTHDLVSGLASLTGESGSYANQVGDVFSGLMAQYTNNSGSTSDQVPTVFVDDALEGFQKSYSDLYGVTSTARTRDNILA